MPKPSRPSPTPPPTRQITSRKTPEQRHRELLDAAVSIGATEGLGAVTLAAVAAAAGVSSGLVHHYFSSAQELVNATFRHAADTDLDTARTRVAAATTPTAQITELLDYLFDETSADAAALWVDAASMGRRSPTLAAQADTVNTAWLAFLADIVTTGITTGDFHVTNPHTTARRLLTIIDGLGAQIGALPAADLKGIATDFARHELGRT